MAISLLTDWLVMQEMRRRGTAPDVFSFNGVMQANVGEGNWAAALEASVLFAMPTAVLTRCSDHALPTF